MASTTGAVWAIDIGNYSLKALKMRYSQTGGIEILDFDNIQHGRVLSASGITAAERDELIALTLRQFISQRNMGKDEVIVSVPSQNSFARFITLLPIQKKKLAEIVAFEADQQIPFDINEVEWDWQLMSSDDEPEPKIGIFAIKNSIINAELEHFGRENITVNYVQMTPMALYNYLSFDRSDLLKTEENAIAMVNIGAESTDLIVATKSTVWQRSIPMGGNAFTRTIANSFKLSFEKAEKLKRTAAMSKYKRQIFQEMRPVFVDLTSEIQRSLGFYSDSNSGVKILKIVAMGGGTNMRGLLKYLQQTLQISVERLDHFKKIELNANISQANFHENVSDFACVYGLAIQALGTGRIESNLLPKRIAKSMMWASKAKFFIGAACLLLLTTISCLVKANVDKISYKKNVDIRRTIKSINENTQSAIRDYEDIKSNSSKYEATIAKHLALFDNRDIIMQIHNKIISALPNSENNPQQQQLYTAFADGDVEKVIQTPRKDRKQVFITSMEVTYSDDIEATEFNTTTNARPASTSSYTASSYGSDEGQEIKKGFIVSITGYSPYKDIVELMDPAGVGDDREKWGVLNRLAYIEDPNDPLQLFKRAEINHFNIKTGIVSTGKNTPAGIGVKETKANTANNSKAIKVLIDPMTKEIISQTLKLNKNGRPMRSRNNRMAYEANDHWFVLNAKFSWNDKREF